MENNQTPTSIPTSENKFTGFIKRNRYAVFAFTMLIILLSIFTSLVFISSKSTPDQNELVPPTTVPKEVIKPTQQSTLVSPTTQASRYLTISEKTVLETQTKPQIDKLVQVDYSISTVKVYGENWAIMKIGNPNTDQAQVVVKKENGIWNVKLGPGTLLDEDGLRAIGAPPNLINEVNTNF